MEQTCQQRGNGWDWVGGEGACYSMIFGIAIRVLQSCLRGVRGCGDVMGVLGKG